MNRFSPFILVKPTNGGEDVDIHCIGFSGAEAIDAIVEDIENALVGSEYEFEQVEPIGNHPDVATGIRIRHCQISPARVHTILVEHLEAWTIILGGR